MLDISKLRNLSIENVSVNLGNEYIGGVEELYVMRYCSLVCDGNM
jgi:hypothetical protein